jgi:hypothetical protein
MVFKPKRYTSLAPYLSVNAAQETVDFLGKAPVQADDTDKRGGFQHAGGATWWVSTQMDEA